MACLWGAEKPTWGWQNFSLPIITYTCVTSTLRAFMGIKVVLLEDHGTAEIQLHSQIFVTRSAMAGPCQNGCSQFFSSIFLPYFSAQQTEFLTVPKIPPTHPNIGHVSAQQREWYVLSFWNRICHIINYNAPECVCSLCSSVSEADGAILWRPPLSTSNTVLLLGTTNDLINRIH